MKVEVSQVIERPVGVVFRFCAYDHVRNHSRWDPDMELEQVSAGPIGAGTIIRRRNRHSGTTAEGIMEVVEFVPDRAMAVAIRDGPIETRGRMSFEPQGPEGTMLTMSGEFPGTDAGMDTRVLTGLMERSARNIKHLVESET